MFNYKDFRYSIYRVRIRTSKCPYKEHSVFILNQINNNSLLRNGSIVTAICLPEWVDTGKVRVLK